jgi:hypothetical protein
MSIVGCDYHPSMQQIARVETEIGECGERRLMHRAEAEPFYHELKGKQVGVAIDATGHSRWFERIDFKGFLLVYAQREQIQSYE